MKRYRKMKKRTMYPSPVFIWSLADELRPLLQLDAPHEVTSLSYCPYDENIVVGGMANGQLAIWDLEVAKTEEHEARDVEMFHALLDWQRLKEKMHPKVKPAVLTPREFSHKGAITSIRWFHRKHFVTSTGQLKESVKPTDCLRHFVSASVDGGINFWDLDYIVSSSTTMSDLNRSSELLGMVENLSPYNRLNGVLKPIYMLTSHSPITDLIIDDGKFT